MLTHSFRFLPTLLLSLTTFSAPVKAQLDPVGAEANVYLPFFADGGPRTDQWQTQFIFSNPHPTSTAAASISLYGDDGRLGDPGHRVGRVQPVRYDDPTAWHEGA